MLRIGIVGVGTVGSSVCQILEENKDIITARAGVEIVPVVGVVKNLSKKRDVSIKITDNVDDILDDDSIDIVVELMGGVEKPYAVVKKALENGIIDEYQLSQMSDNEKAMLIFAAGLSTADQITDISGRGVGMDVVKSNIEAPKYIPIPIPPKLPRAILPAIKLFLFIVIKLPIIPTAIDIRIEA